MTSYLPDVSPRRAAIIAGVGYLAIFVLAIYANFFVRNGLVEPGDAATTYANIASSELLFRSGILSFLIVFLVDVVVAWALYVLFKAVNSDLSLLTAWFRLVYTVFLGVALVPMLGVVQLVSGAEMLSSFDPGQLQAQVMLLLDEFNFLWLVGLAAFGIHLLMLARLLVAAGSAPRLLAGVVAVAGLAYIMDTTANVLLANYADYADVFLALVAVPSIVGELWLAIWLLARGGKANPVASTAE